MTDEKNAEISIDDAILLKEELGKGITCGDRNSRDIASLEKIESEEWNRFRKEHIDWLNGNTILKIPIVYAILIASIFIALFLFTKHLPEQHYLTVGAICLFAAVFCIIRLAKREGDIEGYYDGFREGLSEGIRRTLGISENGYVKIH